jgi:hypothetical protein
MTRSSTPHQDSLHRPHSRLRLPTPGSGCKVPDLRGRRLATSVARRWVGARDTTVCDVLRPFRPRPVPLLVSARRVGQPTRSDPGECAARRDIAGIRDSTRKSRIGERPRGRRTPWLTPPAALRGKRPYGEQAEEDDEGNRGTVAVERGCSLASPGKRTEENMHRLPHAAFAPKGPLGPPMSRTSRAHADALRRCRSGARPRGAM